MPSIVNTIQKVRGFAALPAGWRLGEGVAAASGLINEGVRFLEFAQGLGITKASAFSGVEGEVQVVFHYGDFLLEFTFELDGSITIARDQGETQLDFQENASTLVAYETLGNFIRLCDSSESYLLGITTTTTRDLTALPSGPQATVVFLSSTPHAALPSVDLSATIFANTIQIHQGEQFFGEFLIQRSQEDALMIKWPVRPEMIATSTSMVGRRENQEACLRH